MWRQDVYSIIIFSSGIFCFCCCFCKPVLECHLSDLYFIYCVIAEVIKVYYYVYRTLKVKIRKCNYICIPHLSWKFNHLRFFFWSVTHWKILSLVNLYVFSYDGLYLKYICHNWKHTNPGLFSRFLKTGFFLVNMQTPSESGSFKRAGGLHGIN